MMKQKKKEKDSAVVTKVIAEITNQGSSLEKAMQEADGRFKRRMVKLENKSNKIAKSKIKNFFGNLEPGELLKIRDNQRIAQRAYYEPDNFSLVEIFPEIAPGEIIMYLGWVDKPGEEYTFTSKEDQVEVKKMIHGPKFLIREKVYIGYIPSTALDPVVVEIPDDVLEVMSPSTRG